MAKSESLFQNLMHRRVPQITGMYIAAMWLVIELGDWVTERFGLAGNLTSYVFIAMLVMLPAVLLVAYNHGAPGRDRWTRLEKVFVPINVALAAVVLWSATPRINAEAATETMMIENEMGEMQEFEVARRGYHREIIAFFWQNDTGNPELDWLSYGLPILLEYDINRVSPVVTADTPLDTLALKDRLREQGYDRLTGVPSGLAVELSGQRQSDALVVGSFGEDGNAKVISVRVLDASSGEELQTFTATANDWMTAVDAVTTAVLGTWEITPAENRSDDPVSEHFSNSLEAVRHFVLAQVAIQLDGNYPLGVSEFQSALEIDPMFAEALGDLSVRQYLSGDLAAARDRASQALRNSYRLSTRSEFVLKANRYIFDGDYDRGQRVLDIWTEVEPNSTRALQVIAQFSRMRGTSESLDKAQAAYNRLLELRPNDYSIYRQKADIELQIGNYEEAIAHLSRYLEFVPDSGAGYTQLAGLYLAQGELDASQAALEDAAILLNDPLQAELGLARLDARRGMFQQATDRLERLQANASLPPQQMQVMLVTVEIILAQGRIGEAMALTADANELAKTILPPANRVFSIEAQTAGMLSLLGRSDEAIEVLDGIAANLQPPMSLYLNSIYTTVHGRADNRDEFRRFAQASQDARNQLPELFQGVIALERAQLDIWDENFEAAVENIDAANAILSQSVLQVLLSSLSVSELYVDLARLYLEAGAVDKAKEQLESVLRVYPSFPYGKLVLAQALIASGDVDDARLILEEVTNVWSVADDDFHYLRQAREVLASLEG
ncbi:MAG: tetratricopeptide repeat protein [Woeseiaceae bacterium]|nr:tetratricopeptide repeat protein [Woeseiaceae bacterium]